MDEAFYSVAIPEPTTILGLRLRPFSLGHLILLHRVRSAFVTPDEPSTLHDLALSVLICSLPYRDGCDLFNRTDLPKFFRKWHDKLAGVSIWTRLGFRNTRKVDYAAKVAEFFAYINSGSKSPNYSYAAAESYPIECPTVQLVKCALLREFSMPESELMDRPWAMCLWDYVTLRALDGKVRFEDTDRIAAARAAADEAFAKLKGLNGNP